MKKPLPIRLEALGIDEAIKFFSVMRDGGGYHDVCASIGFTPVAKTKRGGRRKRSMEELRSEAISMLTSEDAKAQLAGAAVAQLAQVMGVDLGRIVKWNGAVVTLTDSEKLTATERMFVTKIGASEHGPKVETVDRLALIRLALQWSGALKERMEHSVSLKLEDLVTASYDDKKGKPDAP